MFKQLIEALKARSTLEEAFEQLDDMLDHAAWMFSRANDVLRGRADALEVRDSIYDRDKAINDLQRSIRRKIVRHLVVNPGSEVPTCLALMTVAKDAERIGDYCKNVFEVGQFYGESFDNPTYHDPLEAIRREVEGLFASVRKALEGSDAADARLVIAAAEGLRGRCDAIIEQLLGDRTSMSTHEAVAYSLLARHYKRVAAHISNICTAITGEIEELDYPD
ncbi:MAG: phosphate signaling complex PhoU family protein [Planctomycetota bacterium]|jgi:phosphate uptake regulator